jgi:hypothetical protein
MDEGLPARYVDDRREGSKPLQLGFGGAAAKIRSREQVFRGLLAPRIIDRRTQMLETFAHGHDISAS